MKSPKFILLAFISLALATPLLLPQTDAKKANAANVETDMSKVSLVIGESFDTDNIFYDDFSSNSLDANWAISNRVWGGNGNHGVVADNVFLNTAQDKLVIRALGNQHVETSTVNNLGGPLSGGAVILKRTVRPGRYETRMKLAYKVGVCSAFWTYTEDGSGNNHEIDIEIPPKANDGSGNNVFNQALFTNWVGETNYDQANADLPVYLNDGEYHTYAFDWYYSSSHKFISYYIDGKRYATLTVTSKVPYLPTRLWLGAWIPNNAGFVGLPNFDKCYMEVDYVKYSPFKNQLAVTQGNAGGYGNTSTNYHIVTDDFEYDWMSNGTFHSLAKSNSLSSRGYTATGTVTLSNNYGNGNTSTSGGARVAASSSLNYQVNSIVPTIKYDLSHDYKGTGQLKVSYYNTSKQLISTENFNLTQSASYTSFSRTLTIPNNTLYATTSYQTSSGQELYLDNIKMLIHKDEGGGGEEPGTGTSSEEQSSEAISSSEIISSSEVISSSEQISSSSEQIISSSEEVISSSEEIIVSSSEEVISGSEILPPTSSEVIDSSEDISIIVSSNTTSEIESHTEISSESGGGETKPKSDLSPTIYVLTGAGVGVAATSLVFGLVLLVKRKR